MSYDKKLNTDTIISRSGLDYRTHSTEDVICVTLERSRPSKTDRKKERKKNKSTASATAVVLGEARQVLVERQLGSTQYQIAAR
jgi:hypothetical protein